MHKMRKNNEIFVRVFFFIAFFPQFFSFNNYYRRAYWNVCISGVAGPGAFTTNKKLYEQLVVAQMTGNIV